MVSKRNFFSIGIMMAVLLFLFQFSMVMRDGENVYDINTYMQARYADSDQAWKAEKVDLKTLTADGEEYIVYIGEKSSEMNTAVSRWCTYTKRNLLEYNTVAEFPESTEILPKMIVLESEDAALAQGAMKQLKALEEKGVVVVFGSLEDPDKIKADSNLMEFLGIKRIVTDEVKMTGVRLFAGLLLGGENVYQAQTKKEREERQDLDLNVPWYQTGSGTKVYMTGLLKKEEMEKEKIEDEDLPALIWRNGIDGGSVFAVIGDYMKDSTATGLLDGMLAEASEYTIYPVINAQNLSLVNFPGFADENDEALKQLYSRSVTGITRDIMWPSLIAIAERSHMKMTCFLNVQSDYLDDIEPKAGQLVFYLKQMKEQDAEAGISFEYERGSSMKDKAERDSDYLSSENGNYLYGAGYASEKKIDAVLELEDIKATQNIGTIVCEYNEKRPVVSYGNDAVTVQMATNDGMDYTYSDDLRMRSIQSSLGYTNIMLDMKRIFWPQSEKDGWQLMQEKFSSNLLTYWKNFSAFTSTTLSESNTRTRTFLKTTYSHERTGNEITLDTSEENSWFILRLHDEEIDRIHGGNYTKIEEGAYLIEAEQTRVTIGLKKPQLYYYTESEVEDNIRETEEQ